MSTSTGSAVAMSRGAFPALGDKVGVVEAYIDLATVSAEILAKTGTGLANGDIIECLAIPKGTVVLMAGIEVVTAIGGTCTGTDLDLGVTGGTVDRWVDGLDLYGAAAGTFAVQDQTAQAALLFHEADTIDLLCNSFSTAAPTSGVLRVFAVVADVNSLKD